MCGQCQRQQLDSAKLESLAETACQCHGIKHRIKYGFNAISHICIQWSMTLEYISSCEVARAI